jgi:hypothetical protein
VNCRQQAKDVKEKASNAAYSKNLYNLEVRRDLSF